MNSTGTNPLPTQYECDLTGLSNHPHILRLAEQLMKNERESSCTCFDLKGPWVGSCMSDLKLCLPHSAPSWILS